MCIRDRLGARYLRVNHHGPVARSCYPVGDGGEIVWAGDRDTSAAETAPDRGDVGGRESDMVKRVTAGAEVVDFRSVGLVVVDHDEQVEAEPDGGLKFADGD